MFLRSSLVDGNFLHSHDLCSRCRVRPGRRVDDTDPSCKEYEDDVKSTQKFKEMYILIRLL